MGSCCPRQSWCSCRDLVSSAHERSPRNGRARGEGLPSACTTSAVVHRLTVSGHRPVYQHTTSTCQERQYLSASCHFIDVVPRPSCVCLGMRLLEHCFEPFSLGMGLGNCHLSRLRLRLESASWRQSLLPMHFNKFYVVLIFRLSWNKLDACVSHPDLHGWPHSLSDVLCCTHRMQRSIIISHSHNSEVIRSILPESFSCTICTTPNSFLPMYGWNA